MRENKSDREGKIENEKEGQRKRKREREGAAQ